MSLQTDAAYPGEHHSDLTGGFFRRRIMAWVSTNGPHGMEALAPGGWVHGAVEDDLHHFHVHLRHDGQKIVEVTTEERRIPWTTCATAGLALHAMVGTPLDPAEHQPRVSQGHNCTHMLDAARLALAHLRRAARQGDAARRQYEIEIPDRESHRTTARIWRDGALVHEWLLHKAHVEAPDDMAGHSVNGRSVWPERISGNPDLLEAALILRRGILVSGHRIVNRKPDRALDMGPRFAGACHTFQPGNIELSRNIGDNEQDFSERREALLADVWRS